MKFNGKPVESIGLFTKTNGSQGELIFSYTNNFKEIKEKEWIFVEIQQGLVPFFVEKFFSKGKKHIILLKYIISQNQAEYLVRKNVYILGVTEKAGDKTDSLIHFTGYFVVDRPTGRKLGLFSDIIGTQVNLLMKIQGEQEILVPLNPKFIEKIDKKNKIIFLNLPDGFLDI